MQQETNVLTVSNLGLVYKIAQGYRRSGISPQDLVQEGSIGLLIAVRRFDPNRGVKLSTYAAWWIRAYILKYILDNTRLVRLGTTQHGRDLFFSLRREQQRLAAQGVDPSPAAVAQSLGVSEREVADMSHRLEQPELSLDARGASGDDSPLMERLNGPDEDRPDHLAEQKQLRDRLRAAVDRFGTGLCDRERALLAERVLCDRPATLDQIGRAFGISRERARQLEQRLRTNLNGYLEEELTEPVAVSA